MKRKRKLPMSGCEECDYFKVSVFLPAVSELHSMCLFQSIHSGIKKGTFGLTDIQMFSNNKINLRMKQHSQEGNLQAIFMCTVLFGKLRVQNAFRISLPHSACYNVACQRCIRPPRSSWGYCPHGHCPQCWRRLAAWSCRKEKVSSCVLAWWPFNFWRSFKIHLFFPGR